MHVQKTLHSSFILSGKQKDSTIRSLYFSAVDILYIPSLVVVFIVEIMFPLSVVSIMWHTTTPESNRFWGRVICCKGMLTWYSSSDLSELVTSVPPHTPPELNNVKSEGSVSWNKVKKI